jgi:hypothetical protein
MIGSAVRRYRRCRGGDSGVASCLSIIASFVIQPPAETTPLQSGKASTLFEYLMPEDVTVCDTPTDEIDLVGIRILNLITLMCHFDAQGYLAVITSNCNH